ncbi:NAD(P)-dependent dehydrogenase (short-subunit alcohol dehydrogenase family) [Kushneria sinocarnis]|uniref:NAD(P)-dependent dehydrogenase (Short-subunit alcohol dehydrogenase family) n=1 Tax=Kushneria sinocarnis TaxID=595502 RepID=A0A420X0V9_9GAMM|nr:SDR family oxidoreductase [Kushneria sinocarnis]RKR07404.1 NAD(P)-dependent dehydrogenase (short-subunit alcohol dehydrogenase family) [Kushneria sinocarnis]
MTAFAAQRRVWITGGLGGIGLACAEHFARAGDRVLVTTRDADRASRLQSLPAEIAGRIESVTLDIRDEAAIEHLLAAHGTPDVLVNNAGLNIPRPFSEISGADIDTVFDINVRALMLLTRAVVNAMQAQNVAGRIVNVSSQAGLIGLPQRTVYCASKHAVEGFGKALAIELRGTGIRVNSVAPTFVATEMTRETLADTTMRSLIEQKCLLEALPEPADVAAAVHFLASEGARYMTGTTLKVDAGWTAH